MTSFIKLYNKNCLDILPELKTSNIFKKIIIVTDPPFNIGYHYREYNDNMKDEDYWKMLYTLFIDIPSVVIHYPEYLHKLSIRLGKSPEKVCSWVYNSMLPKQHRDICFYDIKPDFSNIKQPYKNSSDKRILKRQYEGYEGASLYDWWNINTVKNVSNEKTEHPCQMPLEVMTNIVRLLPKNSIIFDPFMGSGTTGVACKQYGYSFIGTEIDEKYFNISKERIDSTNIVTENKIITKINKITF